MCHDSWAREETFGAKFELSTTKPCRRGPRISTPQRTKVSIRGYEQPVPDSLPL